MSVGYANNQIANKKSELYGKIDSYSSKQSKAIQNAKQSYQEKYGNASIFDVANSQKNINTQSAQAQTPKEQTQIAYSGSDNMVNGLAKLHNVIAGIVESFDKVVQDIKQSIYKLSTQEAGQKSSTPKENTNIDNQGSNDKTKTAKQDEKLSFGSTTETVDDKEKEIGKEPTNANEAKSGSQIDKQFMEKMMSQYNIKYDEGTKTVDKNIKEIEDALAGAAETSGADT